jgi:hypothetical protein
MTTLNLSIEFTEAQALGVAQARTAYNATLSENATPLTDTEYLEYVLIGAADSYAAQYSSAEPVPPSPVVPSIRSIDKRRLRLALLQLGYLDTVTAAIQSAGRAAIIDWEDATFIREDYPLVQALVTNLGLDVDEIFTLAEKLT